MISINSKWRNRCPVISFNSYIIFREIRESCEYFYSEVYIHRCEKLLSKCCSLSASMVSEISYVIIQVLKNQIATWVGLILVVCITRVGLPHRSKMNAGIGSRTSTVRVVQEYLLYVANSRRRYDGDSLDCYWWQYFISSLGQFKKFQTVL